MHNRSWGVLGAVAPFTTARILWGIVEGGLFEWQCGGSRAKVEVQVSTSGPALLLPLSATVQPKLGGGEEIENCFFWGGDTPVESS